MGQCTDAMKAKLESRVGFQTAKATLDGLALIIEIELIINKYEDTRYACESHYMGMKKVLNFHQGEDMSDADYLAGFNAKVDVLESHGAEIVVGYSLLKLQKDYRELDWSSSSAIGQPQIMKERAKALHWGLTDLLGRWNRRQLRLTLNKDYLELNII